MISRLGSCSRVTEASLERLDKFAELAVTLDVDDSRTSIEHASSNGRASISERLGLDEEVKERDDVLRRERRRECAKRLGDRQPDRVRVRSVEGLFANHTVGIKLGREDLGALNVEFLEGDDDFRDDLGVHRDGFGKGDGAGGSNVLVGVL